MKAGLLEVADLLVVNKADCPGAEDRWPWTWKPPFATALPCRIQLRRVCMTTASENIGVAELAADPRPT